MLVVNQFYDPEILGKEYVMRGNAAILKCTIPSFVADFVSVTAWIDEDGTEYKPAPEGKFEAGTKNLAKIENYSSDEMGKPWEIPLNFSP